ncbi:Thioredoxin-3, mitochondrial [Nakaseomyces bracarensis]|uniref:Thioredoxin-3, mitochondrial n=1 Tax=Nakaseomyces bracarensis TaxID=273131 RepID=A0ABR4NTB7_9SACH
MFAKTIFPTTFKRLPGIVSPYAIGAKLPFTAMRFQSTGYASIKQVKTTEEMLKLIKDPSKLSVIDFYATWCGPCKAMVPFLSKFVDAYPEVNFYKVDVDESSDLAEYFGVSAMPTFVFAKNDELLHKIRGANPAGLEKSIKELK